MSCCEARGEAETIFVSFDLRNFSLLPLLTFLQLFTSQQLNRCLTHHEVMVEVEGNVLSEE